MAHWKSIGNPLGVPLADYPMGLLSQMVRGYVEFLLHGWRVGALARWRAGALARSHLDRIESHRIGSPRAVAGATAEKKIAKTHVKH